jgi:adenosylcobinamide-GDP ribazoletransferase
MAFTLYSRVPMPRVRWEKENMAYAMCFFPLVGALIGAVLFFWLWLCGKLEIGPFLRAVGAVLIPVALSGAIHLDGFCDTADALGSRQTENANLKY